MTNATHETTLAAPVRITTTGRKDAAAPPVEIIGDLEAERRAEEAELERGRDPLAGGDLAGGDAA